MSLRRPLALALLAFAPIAMSLGLPPTARTAPINPFPSASESYYRLDVPKGTMSVTVEAEIQNSSIKEVLAVPLHALPTAANIVVKRDGTVLATKVTRGSEKLERPSRVLATLITPMRPNARGKFVMTYDVPANKGDLIRMEPGIIETALIGQGAGSFVFVDVPTTGENYFDPGCLKQSPQPSEVKGAGFDRWVCGDVAVVALNTNNPDVLKRCAALDDKCRQRESTTALFSAFVQSITDQNTRGKLEADVQMKDGPKKLVFGFFRRDQVWAEKQFAVAQAALPRLEETFGYAYPNGDRISMRQSHQIQLIGAAGIAFPEQGEVLLAAGTGFDEEVTVHELAHQWAGFNLTDGWLWEGLAEFSTRTVAPALGITPHDRKWQSFGHKDPLTSWHNGSAINNPDYWYGKAGAFWAAYQTAIGGPENMRKVLALTSPNGSRAPFDGRWFMDNGERVSGSNLDKLFLEWVFNPATASALLADRRAVYDSVAVLHGKAFELGLSGTPSDIFDNLDVWIFAPVPDQVLRGTALLANYAAVVALTSEAGLAPSTGVAASWGKQTLAQTAAVIEQQRQAAQVLRDVLKQFADGPADSPVAKQLALAREKFASGDYADAKQLASSSVTGALNLGAAAKMIELAERTRADRSPGFLEKIGMVLKDPEADLAAARAAYAEGDGARALGLSQAAYEAWSGSNTRGLQLLAMLAGVMCVVSVGVWLMLRRIDSGAQRKAEAARGGRTGHVIEASESKSRWKDWENIP